MSKAWKEAERARDRLVGGTGLSLNVCDEIGTGSKKPTGVKVLVVAIQPDTEVEVMNFTQGSFLCFWAGVREVRIGPLTAEQASNLAEELEYFAIESEAVHEADV